MDFGIANVAAITAIVYILGLALRASRLDHKWIPGICGAAGIILGLLCLWLNIPDFPAGDPMTAAAVGGASGLAATGINQAFRQIQK